MAQILLKVVVLSVALFSVNGQFPGLTSSGAGTGSGAALENMMRRLAMTGGGAGSAGADLPSSGGGLTGLSALGATGGLTGLGSSGGLGAASAGLIGSLGGGRRGRGRGQMMRNLMLIQQFGE